jgi:predicted histidine transporter YuiF (NhaC family)
MPRRCSPFALTLRAASKVASGGILNDHTAGGNEHTTGKSNPFSLERFAKIASFCTAVIYGVLFIGYRTYYHELGITPEDIGVGSAFVLVRSIGFIALVIGAVLLVGLTVNVLDSMSKDRKKDAEKRKENAKARNDANP